ncbi:MAG: YbaN family protein [Ignavibacteriales bacterium]|nr:YbaN family protein [Ignavibacteriales bacterium]
MVLGWLFIVLGTIGIFLPLMPTTIFFILAAWCFARSSEKFYNRLINHPIFGKIVRDYREKKGMPIRAKIISITMMAITISCSALFFTEDLIVRILLLIIAVSVSIYILSLKTLRDNVSSETF